MPNSSILNVSKSRQPFVVRREIGDGLSIVVAPHTLVFSTQGVVRCTTGHIMYVVGGLDRMLFLDGNMAIFTDDSQVNQI